MPEDASSRAAPPLPSAGAKASPRVLITAGPSHEPIDAVRFIGNRSSGRMGCALADAAAGQGLRTTLLLGPTHLTTSQPGVEIVRFVSCAELEKLLAIHAPEADIIIMAAAVADYRPRAQSPADLARKIKRSGEGLTLELEATPDLIAGVASRRPPGQLIVGFALEPAAGLVEAARTKLSKKRLDMVVGNPLETMESEDIAATVLWASGRVEVPAALSKPAFAAWLLEQCVATWKKPA